MIGSELGVAPFMLRSFDHAAYYETRLILAILGLAIALRRSARGDFRYLVMFASGSLFQALMEANLAYLSMRGGGYHLSVFGIALPTVPSIVLQGLSEGGILGLMSFWYMDVFARERAEPTWRRSYLTACGLIVALAFVVGVIASKLPVTSARPMFSPVTLTNVTAFVGVSIVLVRWRSRHGLRQLGAFCLGCLVYLVLTFEPMHLFGARYVALRDAQGQFVTAPFASQVGLMALSYLVEVVGSKVHYFAVPFALGLLE